MDDFFDARAAGYEEHMEQAVVSFHQFYRAVASAISKTDEALQILDIGCGTGLELNDILSRVPNAILTGIDVSKRMLQQLREAYEDHARHLILVQGSYLEVPLGEAVYDYVIAVMTLHHLVPSRKRRLYPRIRRALKFDGAYIEGDWFVSPEDEACYLSEYERRMWELGPSEEGSYHIDVPLSLETQTHLLSEAGFSSVDVIWHADGNGVVIASN
jgi:tRNA (cmo5U34)-methyltransferase